MSTLLPWNIETELVKISHLGVTIGNEQKGRIIALPTSEVFHNQELISSFLNVLPANLDNGFQAHLYTTSSDSLVVYLHRVNDFLIEHALNCLKVNAEIWRTLTGIQLASNNFVIAFHQKSVSAAQIPPGIHLCQGSLLQVAINKAKETGKALVAFVFNEQFLQKSGIRLPKNSLIRDYSKTTTLLMDKNSSIKLLQKNGVPLPATYFSPKIKKMDKTLKFVFKPSGGAAGLGVYLNEGKGASLHEILLHICYLKKNHLLPDNYQIQEFLPGPVYGALILFRPGKQPEILQIHDQVINPKNKFIAGSWSRKTQSQKYNEVEKLVKQIATIKELKFIGLMGIDLIDGKVIEINPRLTASSPISHLLHHENAIKDFLGLNFEIKRIDINTGISISQEMILSGRLKHTIFRIWKEHNVLILPQGLNPAGNSRILFINDNSQNRAQQKFLKAI